MKIPEGATHFKFTEEIRTISATYYAHQWYEIPNAVPIFLVHYEHHDKDKISYGRVEGHTMWTLPHMWKVTPEDEYVEFKVLINKEYIEEMEEAANNCDMMIQDWIANVAQGAIN